MNAVALQSTDVNHLIEAVTNSPSFNWNTCPMSIHRDIQKSGFWIHSTPLVYISSSSSPLSTSFSSTTHKTSNSNLQEPQAPQASQAFQAYHNLPHQTRIFIKVRLVSKLPTSKQYQASQYKFKMCDYNRFSYTCSPHHDRLELLSYCHFARNDPYHQCFGVKVVKNHYMKTMPCEDCGGSRR
jgi:hypothetical protein